MLDFAALLVEDFFPHLGHHPQHMLLQSLDAAQPTLHLPPEDCSLVHSFDPVSALDTVLAFLLRLQL